MTTLYKLTDDEKQAVDAIRETAAVAETGRSLKTPLPSEPGFYPCFLRYVKCTPSNPNPPAPPAVLEVFGITPYLSAFIYAGGESREVDPNSSSELLWIGDRLAFPPRSGAEDRT